MADAFGPFLLYTKAGLMPSSLPMHVSGLTDEPSKMGEGL
jgi:hypothetical protein